MRWKPQHLCWIKCSSQLAGGQHRGVQGLGCLIVGDDYKRWSLCCTKEVREIECAGSCRQPGDTTTPRSDAKMPPYTLKGFRVFQVRKQFTDEG